MRRALAIGCLATIAAADWTILRRRPRWLLIGLADEPAHLATAGLVLLNLPATGPRRSVPRRRAGSCRGPAPVCSRRDALVFLAGAIAIDADHIPLALAATHPNAGDPRPRTHTLLVPVLLALAGQHAAAAGVCAHYLRDVASEGGIPAFAPFSDRVLRVPYPVYAVAMTALAARAFALSAEAVSSPAVYSRSHPSS